MALTWLSLTDFKARLGITGSGSDAVLTAILEGVEASVAEYVGGPVLNAAATEYYSPEGTDTLVLRRRPVVTVTSVWESFDNPRVWDSDTLLTVDTDYRVNAARVGTLTRVGAVWPAAWFRRLGTLSNSRWPLRDSVRVLYTSGFGANAAALPASFLEAGYGEGAARWSARKSGAGGTLQSGSLNGASWSRGAMETGSFGTRVPLLLSPAASALLWPYKDFSGGVGSGAS